MMKKPSKHLTSYSTGQINARLLLLCVAFGQIVSVASPSSNKNQEAESLRLLLIPGPGSPYVSWTVGDQEKGTISRYTVTWRSEGEVRGEKFVHGHEGRVLNIAGWKPLTTYNVSVTTDNENGTSLESRTATLIKAEGLSLLLTPGKDSIHVSWTVDDQEKVDVRTYKVAWRSDGRRRGELFVGGDEGSVLIIPGLKPCTTYDVSVTTDNMEETAVKCRTTTFVKEPPAVERLSARNITARSLALSWERPPTACEITYYNITYSGVTEWGPRTEHTGNATITREDANSTTTIVIDGLRPYTNYTVTVAVSTEAGEGDVSTINANTKQDAPTVPIQDSCNSNSENETVSLFWTKPESDCNISSYEVHWTHVNGTNITSTVPGTVQHFNISTLVAKGRVCVAAVVGEDRGDWRCCKNSDTSSEKSEGKPKTRIGVTIGSVGAIVAIIAFVVVVIVTLRRRYQKHPTEVQWMGSLSSLTSSEQDYYATLLANIKANLEPLKNKRTLAAEFDRLNKASFEGETTVSQLPTNRKKNRYNNMTPFDTNRVRLRKGGKDVSDYINASFVKSSVKDDVRFIACQGPLSNTVSDFWWMVWEQSVKTIVMLLRSDEGEKNKCFQYWPEFKEELFSPFIITLQDRQIVYGLIKRDLLLKKGNEIRAIRHFQFISWPDFGVPNSENELLMLVRDVREAIEPEESSVVVHCSAGVGRTGTFIALWQLEVQAERRLPDIDIRNTVLELRRYRQMLVQKPAQYHYLHVCFIAYLEDVGMWTRPKSRAKSAKQEHRFRSLFKSTPDLSETHTRKGTPPQIRPSTMIQNVFCSLPSRKESPQPENIALIERIVPQPNLKTDAVNNGVNPLPTQIDPIPLSPASEMVTHESNEEIENNDCRKKFPIDLVIKGPNKNSQTNTHTLTGINDSIPLDFSATNEEKEQAGNSAIGNPIYYTNFTDERKALMGTKNSDTPSRADGRNGSATELHHHSTR